MDFNRHSDLEGKHAFLGASNYHWIGYDNEKLEKTYIRWQVKIRGTELHEFAKRAIELGVNLPKNQNTLNLYVNDAIGYQMTPEQILYYSSNCFGTADTISFRDNFLRIHDLKTGGNKTSMHQLEIYAALFCLEYHKDPSKIQIELRIYQSCQVQVYSPEPNYIREIMNKIIEFDTLINRLKAGGS